MAMSESGPNETEMIARRAYEIWEAEGHPHGRDREHWEMAAMELGSPAPMPKDFHSDTPTPALDAASAAPAPKKPATRRKKAAAPEGDAPAADGGEAPAKPVRKRRTTAASEA